METLWPISDKIQLLPLIFIRVGALMFAMPMFGASSVPVPVRVGLAFGFCWAFLPLVAMPQGGLPSDLVGWTGSALREAMIGLGMGWLVRLALAAAPFAGQLLGYQMGFGIANVMDPVGQQQLSVIAQVLNLMALWLFFALNGHHLVVTALMESFQKLPPGGGAGANMGGVAELGLESGRQLFRSALLLAAPVLLILIFVQVGMGIVARTVPQMNIFIVALPMQIGVGLLTLGGVLGFFAPWLAKSLQWLDGVFVFFLRSAFG